MVQTAKCTIKFFTSYLEHHAIVGLMNKVAKKVKRKLSDAERVEFAKQLEHFYEVSYADFKKVFIFSLLKGIATGLGVFLGGTIVVTLLLWFLSQFSGLPFVDHLSKAAEQSIEQSVDQSTK